MESEPYIVEPRDAAHRNLRHENEEREKEVDDAHAGHHQNETL